MQAGDIFEATLVYCFLDMEDQKNVPLSGALSKALPSLKLLKEVLVPMFNPAAPELPVSDKVYLRGLYLQDVEFLHQLLSANREHLDNFLPWLNRLETVDHVRDFVKRARYKDIYEGRWVYGIVFDEVLVGMIDFNDGKINESEIAVGYWLSKDYQGKGIMTRSVQTCVDYLFGEESVNKILIKVALGNDKSMGIPNRLDFKWDGVDVGGGKLKGEKVDLVVYSLDRPTWEARQWASI
ncbi:MAG: GNAT family protein [Bacteroidota bacterium]